LLYIEADNIHRACGASMKVSERSPWVYGAWN